MSGQNKQNVRSRQSPSVRSYGVVGTHKPPTSGQLRLTLSVRISDDLIKRTGRAQHQIRVSAARKIPGIHSISSDTYSEFGAVTSRTDLHEYVIEGASVDALNVARDTFELAEEFAKIPEEYFICFTRDSCKLLNKIRTASGATINPEAADGAVRPFCVLGLVANVQKALARITKELSRLERAANTAPASANRSNRQKSGNHQTEETIATHTTAAAASYQVHVPLELIQLRKAQHKRSLEVARQLPGISSIFSSVPSMYASGVLVREYVIQGTSLDVLQRAFDCFALTKETVRIPKEYFPSFTQNKEKLFNEIRMSTGATIQPEASEDSVRPVRIVGPAENVRIALDRIAAELSRLEVKSIVRVTRVASGSGNRVENRQIERFINIPIRHFPRFTENRYHLLNEIRIETGAVITPEACDNGGSRRFRLVGSADNVQAAQQRVAAELSLMDVEEVQLSSRIPVPRSIARATTFDNGSSGSRALISNRQSFGLPMVTNKVLNAGPIKTGKQEQKVLECIICADEQANTAFFPCGHKNFCKNCADIAFKAKRICPYCSSPSSLVFRIFD